MSIGSNAYWGEGYDTFTNDLKADYTSVRKNEKKFLSQMFGMSTWEGLPSHN